MMMESQTKSEGLRYLASRDDMTCRVKAGTVSAKSPSNLRKSSQPILFKVTALKVGPRHPEA